MTEDIVIAKILCKSCKTILATPADSINAHLEY